MSAPSLIAILAAVGALVMCGLTRAWHGYAAPEILENNYFFVLAGLAGPAGAMTGVAVAALIGDMSTSARAATSIFASLFALLASRSFYQVMMAQTVAAQTAERGDIGAYIYLVAPTVFLPALTLLGGIVFAVRAVMKK